ncbi:MAG TPA: O-antigen ligase family protein [Afifellaceae bacterium]|nr:O-antigen ligase family protein [Afifellaceae bacterium]
MATPFLALAGRPPGMAGKRRAGLPPLTAWLAAGVLITALTLGGGTQPGLKTDTLIQLASLALVAAAIWRLARAGSALPRLPLLLMALVAILPLAQLVPLPPSLWPLLPGRDIAVASYLEAGMALPPLPISLDPAATRQAVVALLPALAIGLATLGLRPAHRRQLALLVVLFAFASVLVGLAQAQLGAAGPLRLFDRTSGAVGLFANRNHYAALMVAAMPFAAAWAVGLYADRRPGGAVAATLLLLVYAAMLLGLAMARSRTGLALAGAAGLASVALAWTSAAPQMRGRIAGLVLGSIIFGLAIAANFALLAVLERLEGDLAADYRWDIVAVTAGAAESFFPVGSGFGTFADIYRAFEPAELLRPFHANHAHNDALELVLEGGLPALFALIVFLGWLAARTLALWRAPMHEDTLDLAVARAATIAAWMLVLHSLVDYPLRTTALMSVFALACGIAAAPVRSRRG